MPDMPDKQAFAAYPPAAQALIFRYSALFQRLPVVITASLMRELRGYDWQFPAEQRELDAQLAFLAQPQSPDTEGILEKFAALPLPVNVPKDEWATDPSRFLESFTAGLWAKQGIEEFRECGEAYAEVLRAVRSGLPDQDADHLVMVLIGREARQPKYGLFAKLREQGTYFSNIDTSSAVRDATAFLQLRAAENPKEYQHWLVDGAGSPGKEMSAGVHSLAFNELGPVRSSLQATMQGQMARGICGPESARTALMSMQPEQVSGFRAGESEIMKHFTLRLLTDGSGTQVFSTTFVQWTSREILRRARPRTLLARYAPRVSKLPQNLFSFGKDSTKDADGALQDGDMGAYYTWLNLMSLSGEGKKVFVAAFEGGSEAVAVAPAFAAATTSKQRVTMQQILSWAAG